MDRPMSLTVVPGVTSGPHSRPDPFFRRVVAQEQKAIQRNLLMIPEASRQTQLAGSSRSSPARHRSVQGSGRFSVTNPDPGDRARGTSPARQRSTVIGAQASVVSQINDSVAELPLAAAKLILSCSTGAGSVLTLILTRPKSRCGSYSVCHWPVCLLTIRVHRSEERRV